MLLLYSGPVSVYFRDICQSVISGITWLRVLLDRIQTNSEVKARPLDDDEKFYHPSQLSTRYVVERFNS